MHIMRASGRDPAGPTVWRMWFFEKEFSLKAPSRLVKVFVACVVHKEFEKFGVKSGNCFFIVKNIVYAVLLQGLPQEGCFVWGKSSWGTSCLRFLPLSTLSSSPSSCQVKDKIFF